VDDNRKKNPLRNSKIVPMEELAGIVASQRNAGKVVVHCHGVFDLMHIGHIKHFEEAKKLGDVLIVTVTQDRHVNKGPNRPVFTEAHRAWAISALSCVDYVAVNKWPTATDTIRLVRPSVFVKGAEFRDRSKDRTGAIAAEEEAVLGVGGTLAFTDDIVFSSSNLLNRYFGVFPEETERFLAAFSANHSSEEVLSALDHARQLKVLVIGETIIDEYQYCETLGKTGKEPVLAARYVSGERFPGGILAVANHVASVTGKVTMLTLLGQVDSEEEFIRAHLKPQVEGIFFCLENTSTIVKRRFLESYPFQKLFEVYVMGDVDQLSSQSPNLCKKLTEILPNFDLVIVADYGHGMISPEVADVLCRKAKFLAVNTQVNAGNFGYNMISKYARADFISISEKEIRLETRNPQGKLEEIVRDVANRLSCERVVITQGMQGCLCYSRDEGFCRVPALTDKVVDRVGAGDAVFAITALCAAQKTPMEVVGFIASSVGAQAVGIVGNRDSIDAVALARSIECLMK
jgi:rfaE bifunctional protein kinase chain/domain/rfaE bifunctional protein nucleotidyltransferase chain/domain